LIAGLKQLCESKPTSLAWNIITLFNNDPRLDVWDKYLDNVWGLLKSVDHDSFTYEQALLIAATQIENGIYEQNILKLSIQALNKYDLAGMGGYLYE